MANLGINPWSFTSTDPAIATITGATGLTLNADGTVSITTTAPLTFNVNGVPPARWFTVIGATNAAYNGEYILIIGASGASAFTMVPQFSILAGTAQSGGGTLAQCLWPWGARLEDLSWQNPTAAGHLLDLRQADGGVIWQATATGAGSQNRGKLYWVNGITPITIQSGIVILTID
jgi:hypothetical protein